jgi:hypothetical protein
LLDSIILLTFSLIVGKDLTNLRSIWNCSGERLESSARLVIASCCVVFESRGKLELGSSGGDNAIDCWIGDSIGADTERAEHEPFAAQIPSCSDFLRLRLRVEYPSEAEVASLGGLLDGEDVGKPDIEPDGREEKEDGGENEERVVD